MSRGLSRIQRQVLGAMRGGHYFNAAAVAAWRVPMIRLLLTALLCALASSQATAQNWLSQTLLGLNEDERNETFTYLLQDSNAKCDRVVRTLFNGSTVELDDWEVLCRDRNSYSLSIPPEPNADVDLLNCRELLAASKMLAERAGSKIKARGCRIKSVERLRTSRRLIR